MLNLQFTIHLHVIIHSSQNNDFTSTLHGHSTWGLVQATAGERCHIFWDLVFIHVAGNLQMML